MYILFLKSALIASIMSGIGIYFGVLQEEYQNQRLLFILFPISFASIAMSILLFFNFGDNEKIALSLAANIIVHTTVFVRSLRNLSASLYGHK